MTTLSPLSKVHQLLITYKEQAIVDYDELIMALQILSDRPFYFGMDEQGIYHSMASGSIDEVIAALTHHLQKLERIKANNVPK